MSEQFSLSFFGDDSPDTKQSGSKFERKSDTGIDKNHGRNTERTWTGPKDPREGKGAGKYPNYWSYKTRSGHVIQYDDSKGNESITIQHRGGSAMQFLPNGAIHMAAHNGKYDVIFGEQRMTITGAQDITVKGEGSMLVYGNYRQTVHGNMEVACTGSYNITAKDMIMNPRDNFTVAGKTGTMKFSDSMRMSGEGSLALTAGKNIVVNAKETTAIGGGAKAFLAGKEIASVYSDNETYLWSKEKLDLKGKISKLTATEDLHLLGKEKVHMSSDEVNIKGDPVKIATAEIKGLIDKAITGGEGPIRDPIEADEAETKVASADKTPAPSAEVSGKYNHA